MNDDQGAAQTPEQIAAQEAEDKGWNEATEQIFPGLAVEKKEETETITTTTTEAPNVETDTATTTTTLAPSETTTTTTTIDPNETPEQKAEREQKEADEAEAADGAGTEGQEPDTSAIDSRIANREVAQDIAAVATDVRDQMYKDVPSTLVDRDGDPMDTLESVMQHINPQTGEAFTQDEAGMWLLAAQQQFNQDQANMEKEITRIAEVNVALKDEADSVKARYGKLLKEMPELRDSVWAQYQRTLKRDTKSNIITEAPVSLRDFYDTVLAPYVTIAQQKEAEQAEADKTAAAKVEADKSEAEKSRSDRSDIFSNGKDPKDSDDDEWDKAHEAVFGPKKDK